MNLPTTPPNMTTLPTDTRQIFVRCFKTGRVLASFESGADWQSVERQAAKLMSSKKRYIRYVVAEGQKEKSK